MNSSIQGLKEIAQQVMISQNFFYEFSRDVNAELEKINQPASAENNNSIRDLRGFGWCSIDNFDSKDLDQLTFAESLADGSTKIYVAIADVSALVKKGTAIDRHAGHNTTSVYTPGKVFPMLPIKLSNNLTSLNEHEDRLAVVVEVVVNKIGSIEKFDVYQAMVHNHAKLVYENVSEFLDNPQNNPFEKKIAEQLQLQDAIAQRLKQNRLEQGMLVLEPLDFTPVVSEDEIVDLVEVSSNRAHEVIEHFMISANVAMTKFLINKGSPVFRRVVKTPKRWDRIVSIANELGEHLSPLPSTISLQKFLLRQKEKDPEAFPELSLTVIKLIGRGEYVVQMPNAKPIAHFGLAQREYSHTTAPNRRYPDLIMQRLLHASLDNKKLPYEFEELSELAVHCSLKEVDAEKVERRMKKSAAAMFLLPYVNQTFQGIVTGASYKGTWVRIFHPAVEGKVVRGFTGLDVGDHIKVQLLSVDVPNGFIDFVRIK